MTALFRFAVAADCGVLAEIYRPYVENSLISLELVAPDVGEFGRRMAEISAFYPYIVYEDGGRVTGYAYATAFNPRPGYGYSATASVYLSEGERGRGVGSALYRRLLALLRAQGLRSVYAIITLPNPASERMQGSFGFERVAVLERVGYKLGKWCDVGWFVKSLGAFVEEPAPPVPVCDLPEEVVADILKS